MKSMKKLFALVMAVAMVASMAVTSGAAGGTLEVTGESTTLSYTVYKMFDVEVAGSGNRYKVTSEWANFVAPGFIKYIDGYVHWEKSTISAADAAAVAELARAYAEEKSLGNLGTVNVNGSISLAEDGYYLLVPNNDTASGVVMVEENETVTIKEKVATPGLPNVIKKVQEDSLNTYGTRNTADIGEIINFQTQINAAHNASNYVLHDKMGEHFEFIDITKVTIKTATAVENTHYTIDRNPDDGCSFHINFYDSAVSGLVDNDTIIVNYTGKLIGKVDTETNHDNTSWLTHTTSNVKTDDSITHTQTYKVDVYKVDQDGSALADAEFALMSGDKYYHWDDVAGVSWVDTVDEATKLTTSITKDADDNDVAFITFYGVDAQSMVVVETKVPGGYTGVANTNVSTKGTDSADTTIGANTSTTITNVLGTALPETGGMGTTLFYVGGGALVLCAMFLLIGKKRAR